MYPSNNEPYKLLDCAPKKIDSESSKSFMGEPLSNVLDVLGQPKNFVDDNNIGKRTRSFRASIVGGKLLIA